MFAPAMFAGQASPAAKPADPYAGESMVFDRLDVVYDMKASGTGVCERTIVIKLQSAAALRQFGVLSVSFASASEHVEWVYVRVRRPNGTVTETPGSGAIEQPAEVTREAPFYSDLKESQLPVKDLQVGDTLEWQVRVVRTRSEAPGQFWGSENLLTEDVVVREQAVELRFPAALNVTVWTNPNLSVKRIQTAAGDEHVYRWESSALKPTTGAAADAEKKARKTHVLTAAEELDAEQGKLPSVAWTTFKSWAEIGSWYRGLLGDRSLPDDEIKAKVAELTAGKTSDEEKIRAVYAYVSTQIRYIGVAFGVGRYQPHQAADVLHNQYGDCKDKATLLSAMLAALGVPSDSALIGAGIRFNPDVPSPAAFNHLITHLKRNGEDVWLDTTEEVAPYRMMYAVLRDRTALVVPATGVAVLETTPKEPPFAPFQTWIAKGSLDKDGVSESHIAIALRGDDELALRAALRQVSPAQYDEFTQNLARNVGYSGTTSHAEISRPDDTTGPLEISFDYHREKAGDWDNLKTVPQLPPVDLPGVDEQHPPVQSINLGTPRTNTSHAEMKLPDGWRAELPEAVHEKTAFVTFDVTYRFEHGTLISERKYTVLQQKVPAADWKAYKKWQDAVNLGMESFVQLVRGGGNRTPAADTNKGDAAKSKEADKADGEAPTAGGSAQAQKLIQDAVTALQQHLDSATASTLLDRAKAADPHHSGLWAAYGYLAVMLGKANEAIEDFHKELAAHPENLSVYAALASAQQMQGDRAGAEATYQQWVEADPANVQSATMLAQLLLADKKPAAASQMLTRSLAAMSETQRKDEHLRLMVGRAQIGAGKKADGAATLTALLNDSDDPEILNNAAYELADAGLELPLCEARQRVAVDKLTAETGTWTLDENPAVLRSKSSLLVAAWDTMGWILFREGRQAEAKTYIEAAYFNHPDPDVRSHIDQLNAALGARKPLQPRVKADVTVNAAALPADQQARTIPLGPAEGRSGVAEYRLLLAQGKVQRAEPSGDKTVPRADELLSRADLAKFFPEGSNARLARGAMVNCFSDKCQLVLEP